MGFVVKRLRTAIRGKSSHRNRHGSSILDDDLPFEVEPSIYPSSEESIDRLQRSGWRLGVSVFTDSSGRTVWRVDGSLGENRIHVEGASRGEAWHKAVEAAKACAVLAD